MVLSTGEASTGLITRPLRHMMRLPLESAKSFDQPEFHSWPFGFNDGEHHSVANGAILEDRVIAQNAILFGTKPLDRAAGLVVVPMSAELHGNATQFLKRSLK